jgi:hypothetical protein
MEIAMSNKKTVHGLNEREFNPFASIHNDDWKKYLGQVVAIDEVNGGIIDAAETVEELYELMEIRYPDAVFSTFAVTDLSRVTRDKYEELCSRRSPECP